MHLEHIALWTRNLEKMREFYVKYFDAVANEKYSSTEDWGELFESYLLAFDAGSRMEIMQLGRIPEGDSAGGKETLGLTHIAFVMSNREALDSLAARFKADGYTLTTDPHQVSDGWYETFVLDPDGNRVEISVAP